MYIALLDFKKSSQKLEVMIRVTGTAGDPPEVIGYILGYDTLTFPPNATAEDIATAVLASADTVADEGHDRLLLQFAVEALLPPPPAE